MSFIELTPSDQFNDSIKILAFKDGDLGRIYFGYCQHRKINMAIKTFRREIWEEYSLQQRWPSIKDNLTEGSLPVGTIDLAEYLYYIFSREARLICHAQNHSNVIRGTRFWWTEDGQSFFECEFVSDRQDLASFHQKIMAKANPSHLSCLEVALFALSFCNGMIYISDEMLRTHNQTHPQDPALGLVHRDIKTENMLITTKNQIRIIDLGLGS